MILVDTGSLVALFDPQDAGHGRCKEILNLFAKHSSPRLPS